MKNDINETAAWTSLEGIAAAVQTVDDVILEALVPVFAQERSLGVAWEYVCALSPQVKANCWALAEAAGHAGWGRFQALLGRYVWDHDTIRGLLAPLAGRWLTCPPDDLAGPGIAIDETAALKKGEHTVAVAPQHAGGTGKVENCVTGVFAAYVTPRGSCSSGGLPRSRWRSARRPRAARNAHAGGSSVAPRPGPRAATR